MLGVNWGDEASHRRCHPGADRRGEPEFSPETAHGLRCRRPAWCGGYYTRQGLSTGTACPGASATPWRRRSGGSARRPITSTTPSGWRSRRPHETSCEKAAAAGLRIPADGPDRVCQVSRDGITVESPGVIFGETFQKLTITSSLCTSDEAASQVPPHRMGDDLLTGHGEEGHGHLPYDYF